VYGVAHGFALEALGAERHGRDNDKCGKFRRTLRKTAA